MAATCSIVSKPVRVLSLTLLLLLLLLSCTSPLLVGPVSAARTPASSTTGPLRHGFYKESCPNAESIVRGVVKSAVVKEARMAGSLLRLHFHDCFVQGCDASVLLKTIPSVLEGEQEAGPNNNSLRGFDVIDDIKAALEQECPGVVSCADVLALAARDSVLVSGGPSYSVLLGRRDSLSASRSLANQMLPSFTFNVSDLVANFANVGLSASDMVVLSGGHTIGKANCATFASRIPPTANDPTALSSSYSDMLARQCPAGAATGAFVNLDVASPTLFDNRYYSNLLKHQGLLHSDQVLYSIPGATHDQVARYASNQGSFFADFAKAMVKMGNIAPLTGSQGQVRKQCGYANN